MWFIDIDFFLNLLLVIVFFVIMIRATGMLVNSLCVLVAASKVEAFGLASLVLAFSTSLPELMVGISAGIQGNPGLSLGNVIGSNIANLSLVVGGAAVISGVLKATDTFLKKDVFYAFLSGALPLLLLMDGNLSRIDGVILIVVYIIYNFTLLTRQRKIKVKSSLNKVPLWRRILVKVSEPKVEKSLVWLVVGVGLLIFSADMIVRLTMAMAQTAKIPVIMVGLFIVAVGTSLPELMMEIAAVKRGEAQMAFGDVLGSVVVNSTLILGITVLLSPLVLKEGLGSYLIATLAYIAVFFLFWLFVWTKHKLERWEGLVLFFVYLLFAWFELVGMNGMEIVK